MEQYDMDTIVEFLRIHNQEEMAEAVADLGYDFQATLRVNRNLEELLAKGETA